MGSWWWRWGLPSWWWGWVFVMGHLWVHGGDGGGKWFLGFVWVGHGGYAAWFLGHDRFAVMVVLVWW